MTKTDKRKLVKRLYELADGDRYVYMGDFMGAGFYWREIINETNDMLQRERRTLAGLAAAYIETEL